MLHQDRSLPVVQSALTNRRGFLAGVVAAVAIGAGPWPGRPAWPRLAAVAAPVTRNPTAIDTPRGAAYVGQTSDPTALIAIVLPDDSPGEAVAYVCDGQHLSHLFTGRARAGMLTLTAPAPTASFDASEGTLAEPAVPTLTGHFDMYGLNGEIALQDRLLSFRTTPAAGIAGLYVADRDASGMIRGYGSTGASFSAQQTVALDGEAPYRIAGTIVLADGSRHEVALPAWSDEAATMRWIILAGGEVWGESRRPERAGGGFAEGIVV